MSYEDLEKYFQNSHIELYPKQKEIISSLLEGQYGLLGIRERVEMLEGRFSIDSQVGKGTALVVEIPIEEAGGGNE